MECSGRLCLGSVSEYDFFASFILCAERFPRQLNVSAAPSSGDRFYLHLEPFHASLAPFRTTYVLQSRPPTQRSNELHSLVSKQSKILETSRIDKGDGYFFKVEHNLIGQFSDMVGEVAR